ncbi:hypothetical protein ACFL0W_01155 [Nanoarchaeota archaeon]
MGKLHTRQKRWKGLNTSKRHKKRSVVKKGARTFNTEAAAKKYAEENKITDYTLEPAKKGKRFKIVKK